jgi:hypothetical protein
MRLLATNIDGVCAASGGCFCVHAITAAQMAAQTVLAAGKNRINTCK